MYGIASQNGFLIKSQNDLCGQVAKITEVLAAYVDLCIARENMVIRQEKFDQYVKWQPEEKWKEEPEYAYYQRAVARLEKTETTMDEMKKKVFYYCDFSIIK